MSMSYQRNEKKSENYHDTLLQIFHETRVFMTGLLNNTLSLSLNFKMTSFGATIFRPCASRNSSPMIWISCFWLFKINTRFCKSQGEPVGKESGYGGIVAGHVRVVS